MSKRALVLAFGLVVAACGGDDGGDTGPRPQTYGEACEKYAAVSCAFSARSERCGEQAPDPDAATCEQRQAAMCCDFTGRPACAAAPPANMQFMSFSKYDTCIQDINTAECGPQPAPPSSCEDAYPS
ncbi:MAG TPA: hypothetical protein VGM90_08760 [Kofleriaceae bacterium]|jgi:hypothetical protein